VTASVCTSTVIAVDRYLVVAQPLKPRGSRRLRLAFIWVVAGALSSVQLAVGRSNTVQVNADYAVVRPLSTVEYKSVASVSTADSGLTNST